MGRGKIEIRRIENATNRQVTYSKRRNGIFKKAQELSVLCDAKVSLIMFSTTGKFHEYISPSVSTKKIYDDYQKALGIDLWKTHYERMQEHLRKLKEINNRLRREIRQRMGEDLHGLRIHELHGLEQEMAESLTNIRDRKEPKCEDPHYGLVDNDDGIGGYDYGVALGNGVSDIYAYRSQHNHHPHLDHHGGGFGSHDLRLA
uniref:Uncharacterized protein n=1 Tax=Rhododendron griersonianum TaxID=479676 RepID=A0AAV6J2G5_9ERIC|nr:hypothetical protein RHGRI_022658 [Rhododendron griersonianum]